MNSIRVLLNSVIDYAGLFPPASLNMSEAVHNYSSYLGGEFSWVLGRFIVPVARLDEFESCAAHLKPSDRQHRTMRLSALGTDDPRADVQRITEFNRRHGKGACANIEAVEWKVSGAAGIEHRMRLCQDRLEAYFEVPLGADHKRLIGAVAGAGGRAKVRTGGLTEETFPPPAGLADFILLCVEAKVPFKATAGLHHPLRSVHPLTYEPSSPSGMMHGFLNVLLASAFACSGADAATVEAVLRVESIGFFGFRDDGIGWRGNQVSNQDVKKMRSQVFVAFGSCSFQEPVSDMQILKLL